MLALGLAGCRRIFSLPLQKIPLATLPNRSIKASAVRYQTTQKHPAYEPQEPRLPESIPESTYVTRPVLLYSYTNRKFYRYMTIFAVMQLFFWWNLAYTQLVSYERREKLRDITAMAGEIIPDYLPTLKPDDPWYKRYIFRYGNFTAEHPVAVGLTYIVLGTTVFIFAFVFAHRAVHQLVLLRGGDSISITTFGNFGRLRTFPPIPLKNVSTDVGRKIGSGYIPLHVRGSRTAFRIDSSGKFHNAALFDLTAGLQRRWRN